jgi:hypothetical protein
MNGSTIAILVLAVEYLAVSGGRLYVTRWSRWLLAGVGDYLVERLVGMVAQPVTVCLTVAADLLGGLA